MLYAMDMVVGPGKSNLPRKLSPWLYPWQSPWLSPWLSHGCLKGVQRDDTLCDELVAVRGLPGLPDSMFGTCWSDPIASPFAVVRKARGKPRETSP